MTGIEGEHQVGCNCGLPYQFLPSLLELARLNWSELRGRHEEILGLLHQVLATDNIRLTLAFDDDPIPLQDAANVVLDVDYQLPHGRYIRVGISSLDEIHPDKVEELRRHLLLLLEIICLHQADDISISHDENQLATTDAQRLRKLASELTRAREVERRKIAAELHDNIGQSLALMKMKLLVLRGDAIFSGFDKNLESVISLLEQTIQATRSLSFEINPPILHELGLVPTFQWLADRCKTLHEIKVVVDEQSRVGMLSEEVRGLMFTCTRELVFNSIKYADVKRIRIETGIDKNILYIRVIDKGNGFDAEEVLGSLYGERGFGLFSIRERVGLLGGQFKVESSPGKGTVAQITLPLVKE